MRTYLQAKAMAKSLRDSLAAKNVSLSHGECLELIAHQFGFGSWNVLASKIDMETAAEAPPDPAGVELQQPIPVIRVDSRQAAREFYVGVLGFQFDWGDDADHVEGEFYAQISRSGAQVHLTTHHHGKARAVADVYFRMSGLDALHREIAGRMAAGGPAIHHTFYDARELALEDPFGNQLRFVENNPPGVSAPRTAGC